MSLGILGIAVCSASCLVTSSPEFDDPEQTPPVLDAADARPDPRNILIIEPSEQKVTFSADVSSVEDLGENILVKLYVDYGVEAGDGRPFLDALNGADVLPAAAGQQRKATVDFFPPKGFAGCHTFTLIVSHAFDNLSECPEVLADSSQLTWQAFVCDGTGPCPPTIDDPRLDCPVAAKRCPDIADGQPNGEAGGAP